MPASLAVAAVGAGLELGGMIVLMIVGSGEKRSAVTIRLIFYLLITAVCSWVISISLRAMIVEFSMFFPPLIIMMGFGALLSSRNAIVEVQHLRHWGEPEVAASPDGLLLFRPDRMIPWNEIVRVTPLRRGVRIERAGKRPVFLVTRSPIEVAARIDLQLAD